MVIIRKIMLDKNYFKICMEQPIKTLPKDQRIYSLVSLHLNYKKTDIRPVV